MPIFIEGQLPPALTLGDATPSDDSPWWLFHRLNRLVLNGPPDAAERVRNCWRPMQQALFTSAYDIAREAKQLIDAGHTAEATSRLTAYMATNADRMIDTVQTLHNELAGQRVSAG